ncbi:MAG: type II secretion system protein M [Oleispira antarctica]|nr:type II secretion system protein M [Oleispira antarctica]MBQ0791280.1 type II secretion system protein M [Oleispira antarctica]
MKKLQQQVIIGWHDSRQKLKKLPPVVSFNLWYGSQSGRDQKIVKAISAFIALCLVIVLFVQPFLAKQTLYQAKLDKSLATYELLASNAHKFQGQVSSEQSNGPILAVVTQQAKQSNINLKRFEPDGDGLRIWVEDAIFDDAIRWLEELNQKHGIQIKQINVERSAVPGRVDLRGTLFK